MSVHDEISALEEELRQAELTPDPPGSAFPILASSVWGQP